MKRKISQFFAGFLAVAILGTGATAQVAVVVGAKSPAVALNADQAASLFLGKSNDLPGAGSATLLDQPETSQIREVFYSKVAGKTAPQVKAAWSRLVFSGKAVLPKELANSAEVKKTVVSNPNAIGYIEKDAVDSSVKVLYTQD